MGFLSRLLLLLSCELASVLLGDGTKKNKNKNKKFECLIQHVGLLYMN